MLANNLIRTKPPLSLVVRLSARSALIRLYSTGYAMGLAICGDVSMSDRAEQIGCEQATLPKFACAWNTAHDLPPSFHQESAAAAAKYAARRREKVQSDAPASPP